MMCPYSLTIPGGVQGQVLGLARALRSKGVDTRVLGPCDGAPPEPGITPLGVSVPTAANGSVAPVAPDPSAQLRTISAIRDEAFDVLHLHEPFAPGPTVTALFLKAGPMVGTFHAAGGSAGYRWLAPMVRWGAGRLTVRCVVSDDARALAEEALGGGEYVQLFNGVDVGPLEAAAPTRTDGPTIFFCGRHEPRKGLDVLLEALIDLPASVRLWIASDGPQTTDLQARWAGNPRIEWLGRISDEEKASRMRGADVFCAPSLGGESFGIVLLEGMAAGTPVVASDIPGYSKVARGGRDARLVPPGEPGSLAAALSETLFGESGVDAVASSGRERASQFSMDRLADRYLELYEQVAVGIAV